MSDLNQPNQPEKQPKGRRVFLQRAAGVSLVSLLPVKSVWASSATGCTVSGNMSGNLSRDCTIEQIAGKSPGYWKTHLESSIGNQTWSTVFGVQNPPYGVPSQADKTLFQFLNASGNGVSDNSGLGGPNNINFHLISAYCNALHGLYPLSPGVTPNQYVISLYQEAANNTSAVATAIYQTYV